MLGSLGLDRCQRLHGVALNPEAHAYTIPLAGPLAALRPLLRPERHAGGNGAGADGAAEGGVEIGVASHASGKCSPLAKLPTGWPGAPIDAVAVCWAYPVEGIAQLGKTADGALAFLALTVSVELRFTAYGGFLLLDASGAVVAAQAIGAPTERHTLRFGKAEALDPPRVGPLRASGRLQSVTLPSLLRAGATHFCWLAPNEVGASRAPLIEYGAFAYLLDREPPIFFRLENPVDSVTKERAARTIQALSRMVSARRVGLPSEPPSKSAPERSPIAPPGASGAVPPAPPPLSPQLSLHKTEVSRTEGGSASARAGVAVEVELAATKARLAALEARVKGRQLDLSPAAADGPISPRQPWPLRPLQRLGKMLDCRLRFRRPKATAVRVAHGSGDPICPGCESTTSVSAAAGEAGSTQVVVAPPDAMRSGHHTPTQTERQGRPALTLTHLPVPRGDVSESSDQSLLQA